MGHDAIVSNSDHAPVAVQVGDKINTELSAKKRKGLYFMLHIKHSPHQAKRTE